MNPLIQVIDVIEVTDTTITLADGRIYEYVEHEVRTQRHDHANLPEDFCDAYLLKTTYDTIFIYKNKWSFYAPLIKDIPLSLQVYKEIEQKKQRERVGEKYKHLKLTDELTLKEFFPIYQDLTACCNKAIKDFKRIFKMLKLKKHHKFTLEKWIWGSKMSNYYYNYLFTEYFEGEAN